MPAFPDIGEPLGSGYKEKPADNGQRTPMDVGPAKTRRRTMANVDILNVAYVVDAAAEATLDAFYRTVGTYSSFDYTHPRTLAAIKVRFTDAPDYGWTDGHYTASLQLEILPG